MADGKLTPRQARFVEEYLIDLNGTQAATRAGFSARTANEQAVRLLANINIKAAIDVAIEQRSKRTGITQDRVLRELERIGFADPRLVMSWGPDGVTLRDSATLTDDEASIVSEVSQTITKDGGSIKLKLVDKVAALTLAARHLKMLTDKTELGGTVTVLSELLGEIDGSGRGIPAPKNPAG